MRKSSMVPAALALAVLLGGATARGGAEDSEQDREEPIPSCVVVLYPVGSAGYEDDPQETCYPTHDESLAAATE